VTAAQLRAMSDVDLADFCVEKLGMTVTEKDEIKKGSRVVGYNRGRLLTRAVQLAVGFEVP
jgi:hypothetical protein